MTNEEFETIKNGCIAEINRVLGNKAREYSSKQDRLHNFNEAKKIMRCNTREYALLGMLNKHTVSVTDLILKYEKEGILPDENTLEEKIGDSINYLILLKACFLEDIDKDKAEKACKCDCEREKEKDDKIKDCPERAMGLTEILKQNESAIANSMYQNPRKKLVVEKLRKKLEPLFVWLTDNNRFVDYEKIKGMINKAELEADSVPDEFIKDIIVFVETMVFPIEMIETRNKIIAEIVKPPMTKFKVGEFMVPIYYANHLNSWVTGKEFEICGTGIGLYNKDIYYIDLFNNEYIEQCCFKTREEAQAECDRRNSEQAKQENVVVNTRKVAVVENMQNKLKPIIEFVQITNPKEYSKISELFINETKKHNSIGDNVFYQSVIEWLNLLPELPKIELPQYRFKTLAEIKEIIIKQLTDILNRM